MLLLSATAITPKTQLSKSHTCCLLFCPNYYPPKFCASLNPKPLTSSPKSLSSNGTSLRHVTRTLSNDDEPPAAGSPMVSSASAVASAIRRTSTSPIEFLQTIETDQKRCNLVLPSPDFQRLCVEQLHLFRRIVDPDAVLSVRFLSHSFASFFFILFFCFVLFPSFNFQFSFFTGLCETGWQLCNGQVRAA